jgi:hypothetical protein
MKQEKNKWMSTAFWKAWEKSNEIERLNLVEQLTGIDKLNRSLINSYFEDLYNYIENETRKK